MKKKGLIYASLLLLFIITLTGCRSDEPLKDISTYQPSVDRTPQLRELEFTNKRIDKVLLDGKGDPYVLSAGKIYHLQAGAWEPLNPGGAVSTFYLLVEKGQTTLVAGTDAGEVYLSDIKNGEWRQADIEAVPTAIDFITACPQTGQIYVGQSGKEGGGLWKGNRKDTDWEKLTDITVRGIAVHPENPKILYIVDKLAYLSLDGGLNWTKLNTGANYGAFIHPLYPETAYLAFSQGIVSVRHNGEITSQQTFFLPGSMTRLEFNPANLNERALGIWDFPSGTGGLYYTFDGGADWVEVAQDIEGSMILDLCFSPDGKSVYIATADKGLWLFTIGGQ